MLDPKKPLSAGDVLTNSIVAMPFGALLGGLSGIGGRCAISFFSPAMASAAGTFSTFAGVGLIAAPLMLIPSYITNRLLSKIDFLKAHPKLAAFLADTADFLITLGAVAAGTALISSAFPATLLSVMIIPAVVYALKTLCNVLNVCLGEEEVHRSTAPLSC